MKKNLIGAGLLVLMATVLYFYPTPWSSPRGWVTKEQAATEGNVALKAMEEKQMIERQIASLPETSAIKQVLEKDKKQMEELRVENENRAAEFKTQEATKKINRELGLSYELPYGDPVDDLWYGLPSRLLSPGNDTTSKSIMIQLVQSYPNCKYGQYVLLECVYTTFLLNRVAPDKELRQALLLAKSAGIQIVISYRDIPPSMHVYTPKNEKRIWISVFASNKQIVDYLVK